MRKSEDEKVQDFLEKSILDYGDMAEIVLQLREIVFKIYPAVNERMMYGGIMFSLEDDFGGVFIRKKHVSFEFGQGFTMKDPQKILEGTGQYRRHLKIKSMSDIENKTVDFFVKQAVSRWDTV